jgi:hypothetical protein
MMNQMNPLLLALLQQRMGNSTHPLPGTGPYRPPIVVDPGETDPAGGEDVNYPRGGAKPGGYIDPLDLLTGLYPGGSGINNMSPRGLPAVNRMTAGATDQGGMLSINPRQALLQLRMNTGRGRPQA